MGLCITFVVISSLVAGLLPGVEAWHDLGNLNYHCWYLNASATRPDTIDCKGLSIRWIDTPGEEIRQDDPFNITFELLLNDDYYNWIHGLGFFGHLTNITSGAAGKEWCEKTTCPTDPKKANKNNCCVFHCNVHSCPLEDTVGGLCGPWIQPSGSTFTHSEVLVGPVDTGNWTSYVKGLHSIGINSLIAHFKIVNMQVAMEMKITVIPRAECGDGKCENEENEFCDTCPADCGACPMKPLTKALIASAVVGVLSIIGGFIGYIRYQKFKLLWNEDWVIPAELISEDEGLRGAFGSMIGSQAELNKKQSAASALTAAGRQVFCRTALFDGRSCAVRHIVKPEFTLTKAVRIEVSHVRELNHSNLVRFVGACIEVPHMCILCEYSAKGSLSDVLLNEEVPLAWSFRFSFISDIARGMGYLHSKKLIHGRLKSNNCVVDDRWMVKIAGKMS